jgi:hypothetical protein
MCRVCNTELDADCNCKCPPYQPTEAERKAYLKMMAHTTTEPEHVRCIEDETADRIATWLRREYAGTFDGRSIEDAIERGDWRAKP